MSGRLFAAVLVLGAAAAGVAAYHKYKKKEEEEIVLEFDLSSDDAAELDELASSAEATVAPAVEAEAEAGLQDKAAEPEETTDDQPDEIPAEESDDM